MSAITIRTLPEDAKRTLRMRAAVNGTSMEAEALGILVAAPTRLTGDDLTWIDRLARAGADYGDLELPEAPDGPATAGDFGTS